MVSALQKYFISCAEARRLEKGNIRLCPVDPYDIPTRGKKFPHELVYDKLHEKGPLTMEQLKWYFPKLDVEVNGVNSLERMINREVKGETIRLYEKNGKVVVELTDKGETMRRFTQGIEGFKEDY